MSKEKELSFKLVIIEILNEMHLKFVDLKIRYKEESGKNSFDTSLEFNGGGILEFVVIQRQGFVEGWFKNYFGNSTETPALLTISTIGNALGQKIHERTDDFLKIFIGEQ